MSDKCPPNCIPESREEREISQPSLNVYPNGLGHSRKDYALGRWGQSACWQPVPLKLCPGSRLNQGPQAMDVFWVNVFAGDEKCPWEGGVRVLLGPEKDHTLPSK